MAKYLTTITETYRVGSAAEVEIMLEEARNATEYTLVKYNCESKQLKAKGEIVDEWLKLTLVKAFNEERDPLTEVDVKYEVI